jgi:putative ABC transport system permease protein
MRSLLRVSWSDVRRHPGQALVAALALSIGVAAFSSMNAAHDALETSRALSVKRLAGQADLQITGVGGVAELQESLRAVPAVAATRPVIEQVVELADPGLGGLLVVGVDLTGDQRMRDYGLEDHEAEVADSLAFLAQQDSIALSRDLAGRARVGLGDAIEIRINGGSKRLTVRALMSPRGIAEAYGGNIALMDVYAAQTLFGRGRHFDRIDVALAPMVSADEGRSAIASAIGPAYRLDTPERRGAELERRTNTVVTGFDTLAASALGLGIVLVAQVFLVAQQRRMRSIGILRAIGATPGQITGMFVVEAVMLGLVAGAVGALAGHWSATAMLRMMSASFEASRGEVAGAASVSTVALLATGMIVGIVAALIGAVLPARRAGALPPVDAMASGVRASTAATPVIPISAAAVIAVISTSILILANLASIRFAIPAMALIAAVSTLMVASAIAQRLIAMLSRRLSRVAPATGGIAGDSLRRPKRTVMTSAVLIASGTFTLGVAGYFYAARASFENWIEHVMTADLYVRASAGWGPTRMHLPYELGASIRQAPGVASVDAIRSEPIQFQGKDATLVAVESERYGARVTHSFIDGAANVFMARLASERVCIVSDDFADAFALRVGDVVPLDAPGGRLDLTIAAIVSGDRRAITIDRRWFVSHWHADRVEAFGIVLDPGVDATETRDWLRRSLDGSTPAIVSTRQALVDDMDRRLGLALGIMQATVFIALLVAMLGVALSQLAVAVERARDIGILKSLGAVPGQIRSAALIESGTLTLVALVLAAPLGDAFAWILRDRVSEHVAGFHVMRHFPWPMLLTLAIGVPLVGAMVTWIPAWRLASQRVSQTLSHE